MVRLSDEEEYEARVVGRDPRTDLALLNIQGRREFPTVKLGDSDSLRVGEWVLAIGNPFGLEQTVTAGIVSAKGRVIGAGPYDDFIQTDAAINPGNSGGPLFNTRGEVVGINSAIAPVSPELAKKLGRPGRDGAVVAEVVPNGPAARSGIRTGDLIVALQGKPIRRAEELPRLTARIPVATDVELALVRDGKELVVKVRLGELPERPQG